MLGMVLSVFDSVDKLLERFQSLECKNIFEADSCEISDSVSTAVLQPGYGLRVKYGHRAVFLGRYRFRGRLDTVRGPVSITSSSVLAAAMAILVLQM